MQSCLGIYLDKSMIKYSKVSKEKDNIKIDSSGVKFYEDLSMALDQIIQETNSQKSPIAINISDEGYDYIDVFSLLSKSDIKKSIDIEFEMLCNERGYDKNLYENRYILSVNRNNPDKMRALNVSVPRSALIEKTRPFEKYKLTNATPISTSIVNLLDLSEKENVIVVNIEDTTTVTTVLGGVIDDIVKINDGMQDILNEISVSENSMSKAYEICKNTTISTQDTGLEEGNEYLDVVMPTIYKIVNEVKRIQENLVEQIEVIYITGSGISINNLDLYFQNYFENIHCEMLRPAFLKTASLKISVKEYMEVNSATALALEGVGSGIPELNFKTSTGTKNIGGVEITGIPDIKMPTLTSMDEELEPKDKLLLRILGTLAIFVVFYLCFVGVLSNKFETANQNLETATNTTESAVSEVSSSTSMIQSLSDDYASKYKKITGESTESAEDADIISGAIPTFLQQLMYSVPEDVTLVSISNTSSNTMAIVAKSTDYEQLGLFKVMLYSDGTLTNVTSTSSYKEEDYIYVTIIGDLPY